ncbi:GGDEF domain-containing protein [Marinobacterium aestuariivivens]|uniref:GGDEF domain-containing protein n=1 Tax=Marinobacterium aestuariivivens TaxID=1698799 RepID=A0ABW1ZXM9_9GAMM
MLESILSTLLNVVGSVKAIYKYTRDLEYYATRDPLTNLYNQRMFWELLEYELDRCERHGYKVALLMLDLDNFKAINDGYGHACGDQLLTELSAVLQQQLRTGDVLARYGGDEFVVILPEASLEVAAETSERILAATQDFGMQRDNGVTVRVTSSIGVGLYPDHARNRKDLFMFVDNLMYRSKSLERTASACLTNRTWPIFSAISTASPCWSARRSRIAASSRRSSRSCPMPTANRWRWKYCAASDCPTSA